MVHNPHHWYQPFMDKRLPALQQNSSLPQNPYYQFDPASQQYQSFIPLYQQFFPYYSPSDPRFQLCRSRCYLLGLTPGTPSWINCVHSCMR
ncbi:hypothetical protein [Jeotgalibacillus proteolyticus]|uniref:Uncharacterized protein n=1 Tax=Jeotgalibacillus proteolyticus TaxID=2082395 RepID=A0A2S5GCT7_9BACL|nr:hypothetical protein [Jeotgalibacillus proteolyticus]PPA70724.1 hypothetical protein C4B60_07975 [Jeotgalibacillus proteolyticus]